MAHKEREKKKHHDLQEQNETREKLAKKEIRHSYSPDEQDLDKQHQSGHTLYLLQTALYLEYLCFHCLL